MNTDRLLEAARVSGAGAIHPGYGFLSENAKFAKAVSQAGLNFVGPSADAIELMGDKSRARRKMRAAGVACVPGYDGEDQSDETLAREATQIGFPVMLKAAAGGGGRGMRLAGNEAELMAALPIVRAEAGRAFGSEHMVLEKAISGARHIEFQIFSDQERHCIHLGERDCSAQRRHQKIVEEAPAAGMNAEQRETMGEAAIAAANAVAYCGAGTVEFLLEGTGAFYFLEMNTRLQVEHPVTELITGHDLVAWQIKVAQGESLPIAQKDVTLDGHAIEARLYAENPYLGFLPDTGRIAVWRPAAGEGFRIDDGISSGQAVSAFYDPLLAKIIAWGSSRKIARDRLMKALEETVVLGVQTNLPFLRELLACDDFQHGQITTEFVDRAYPDGLAAVEPEAGETALAIALLLQGEQTASWASGSYVSSTLLGWSSACSPVIPVELSIGQSRKMAFADCVGSTWTVELEDVRIDVELVDETSDRVQAIVDGSVVNAVIARISTGKLEMKVEGRCWSCQRIESSASVETDEIGGRVVAPMTGLLTSLQVKQDQTVVMGDPLCVLEAMKMQHQVNAPCNGVVDRISVAEGDRIGAGDVMIEITVAAETN